MLVGPPQCFYCAHLQKDKAPGEWKCSAFPDGVPRKIIDWQADHRAPYRGDNGIQFTPMDGDEQWTEAVSNHWRILNSAKQQQIG